MPEAKLTVRFNQDDMDSFDGWELDFWAYDGIHDILFLSASEAQLLNRAVNIILYTRSVREMTTGQPAIDIKGEEFTVPDDLSELGGEA